PPHLSLSSASNILPPIILPPLTPFAVNIPPPKKIELPIINTLPPSEIITPSKQTHHQSNPSPLNLKQENSKIQPNEQELKCSSPKSPIMNNNDVSTPKKQILPEFPLDTP